MLIPCAKSMVQWKSKEFLPKDSYIFYVDRDSQTDKTAGPFETALVGIGCVTRLVDRTLPLFTLVQ